MRLLNLCALALGLGFILSAQSDDEFVGPFASWTNVQTADGAKGDGIALDAVAVQAGLGNLVSSAGHVLWLPCGTYLIDQTLQLQGKEGVSMIGEDPACTTLKWAGAPGGTLLAVDGSDYARIDRITFDGSGTAGVLVDQAHVSAGGNFDTGNQYTDDVFKNAAIGIRCGFMANGCSEMSVLRDHFSNITSACLVTANYNALDIWVRYSVFDHCGVGIGDMFFNPDGTQAFVGAGNFHVYSSVFRYSAHSDIAIGNTSLYSFRNNYSIGSPMFLYAGGTGNPAPMTVQGNTILDSTKLPIGQYDQGPVVALDNIVRFAGSPSLAFSADLIAVGNTFTTGTPYSSGQRLFDDGTVISTVNAGEPTLPGTPPNLHRAIFDLVPGSSTAQFQAAINGAAIAGLRSVVHIPEGTYNVGALVIPANADIQVIGDGMFASKLFWNGGTVGPVISVVGPSHATLREFYINAGFQVDAIAASNIDQAGSRVWMHGIQMGADNGNTQSNLFSDGLDYTVVEAEDIGHASTSGVGIKVIGGPLASQGTPQSGKVNIYSGSSFGETLPYQVSNGGVLLARDTWNESQGPAFLSVSGRASVTFDGAHANLSNNVNQPTSGISVLNLIGTVAIIASSPQDRTVLSGAGAGAQVLQAGGSQDCPLVSPYLLNQATATITARTFFQRVLYFFHLKRHKPVPPPPPAPPPPPPPPPPAPSGVGLLINRECTTTTPGVASIATTNFGNNTTGFVEAALAQTRAAKQAPLTALPAGETDLRLYRLSLVRGVNNLHLAK